MLSSILTLKNNLNLFYFSRVVKYSIVACPSTLKMADKDILKNSLSKIGAQVIREWSEQCTHLCMNSVTVTEKVNYL